MTPAEMAIENVESVLRGEITEPSVGTLAHRVLEFARNYGRAVVTVKYTDMGGQVPISPRTYEAMDLAPL